MTTNRLGIDGCAGYLFAVVLFLSLTGCGEEIDANRKVITVSGSTSVAALMTKLGEIWQKQSGIAVEVQGTGSSAGIRAVANGISQIGMLSREVIPNELGAGVNSTVLAYDNIAVVVNGANSVERLSVEQLLAIYRGEIINWQEVGGSDQPIVVVTRDPASGTRTAFEKMVGLVGAEGRFGEERAGHQVSTVVRTAQVGASNGAVKMVVSRNRFAIGYISEGSVDDTLRMVTLDSQSNRASKSQSQRIIRPFVLIAANNKTTSASRKFLHWLRSEAAQKIVAELGYIPVI